MMDLHQFCPGHEFDAARHVGDDRGGETAASSAWLPEFLRFLETPSFCVANIQQAWNHTVIGMRVRSKMVPAVTEVRAPHSAHMNRPSPSRQPPPSPPLTSRSKIWQAGKGGSPGRREPLVAEAIQRYYVPVVSNTK
jgi:hypothetical protein